MMSISPALNACSGSKPIQQRQHEEVSGVKPAERKLVEQPPRQPWIREMALTQRDQPLEAFAIRCSPRRALQSVSRIRIRPPGRTTQRSSARAAGHPRRTPEPASRPRRQAAVQVEIGEPADPPAGRPRRPSSRCQHALADVDTRGHAIGTDLLAISSREGRDDTHVEHPLPRPQLASRGRAAPLRHHVGRQVGRLEPPRTRRRAGIMRPPCHFSPVRCGPSAHSR